MLEMLQDSGYRDKSPTPMESMSISTTMACTTDGINGSMLIQKESCLLEHTPFNWSTKLPT